ncbi:uncharacterized protein SCHCODRAFT_02552712 [Schizophyllum commune H4-8]|nr:uncharacterized protein SCHCODRAFT_02552712 [Schizophyllum commune H4-8]KAI5887625.1 hypothetical protein SCHCODRAFT_02552712 [Schizophyllum commune H4-8]
MSLRPRFRAPSTGQCFINQVPDELLEIMFVLSLPDALVDPKPGTGAQYVAYMRRSGALDYPALIAQVCPRWKDCARSSQALHAYLFVDAGMHEFMKGKNEIWRDRYFTNIVARSGSRPLTLSIDVGRGSAVALIMYPPFKDSLPRLRRLCLNFNHRQAYDYPLPLLSPHALSTPMLDTVHIHCGADRQSTTSSNAVSYFLRLLARWRRPERGPIPAFHDAPRLVSFSFEGLRSAIFNSPLLFGLAHFPFSKMTCFCLPEAPCYSVDVFNFMMHMPCLRTFRCTLYEVEDQGDRAIHEAQTPWSSLTTDFPQLNDLDIMLATQPGMEGNQPPGVPGLECFLGALTAPALTSLTISRRVQLGQRPYDWGHDEEGLLVPALQGFIERSRCTITKFELATFGATLPELVSALQLMPALRTLRLDSTMVCMEVSLLHALARPTDEGLPALVPRLRCLVIDNARVNSSFKNSDVLDMVEARWPVGWSEGGIAHVEVAHFKEGEGSLEAETRYQERLEAMAHRREDIELDIRECVDEAEASDEEHGDPRYL